MSRVQKTPDGAWAVVADDGRVLAVFETNAAAWRWFDTQNPQAIADENQRRRISVAFTEKASA